MHALTFLVEDGNDFSSQLPRKKRLVHAIVLFFVMPAYGRVHVDAGTSSRERDSRSSAEPAFHIRSFCMRVFMCKRAPCLPSTE